MKELFGTLEDGRPVYRYLLKDGEGEVFILDLGATVQSFLCFGQRIVCGFDSVSDYLLDDSYQGATIGRVANRIGGATFEINGTEYRVENNEGENSLHGGFSGFSRRLFTVVSEEKNAVCLKLESPDGEGGYPGNLTLLVTYTLSGTSLSIDYRATTDKATPLSLTNHSYFNLSSLGESVLSHTAMILADSYTEVDKALIPTGNRLSVNGTDLDLRAPTPIGNKKGGFDHNFHLSEARPSPAPSFPPLAASFSSERLTLSVYTTQTDLQLYTAVMLEGEPPFYEGIKKARFTAFCAEAQSEPGAVKRGGALLLPGEVYQQRTVYSVSKK